MFKILVSCHATTHTILFGDDRALAEAELAKLVPLIGRDRWGKNGKGDEPTHTIKCPAGDVTVVLEKVEVARLLDTDADHGLHELAADREYAYRLGKEIEFRKGLASAGFDPNPR
jgi:hypothetical protein